MKQEYPTHSEQMRRHQLVTYDSTTSIYQRIAAIIVQLFRLTFPAGVLMAYVIVMRHGIELILSNYETTEAVNYGYHRGIFIIFFIHMLILPIYFCWLGALDITR